MRKTKTILIISSFIILASIASAQEEPFHYPEPVLNQVDFLMVDGIDEFNVEYALDMTERYANIFINPFDAVFLHVEFDGQIKDFIVITDAVMNRLTIFQIFQRIRLTCR